MGNLVDIVREQGKAYLAANKKRSKNDDNASFQRCVACVTIIFHAPLRFT